MGLDTSHNAWHGAYGSFARWRNELARAAGYGLAKQPLSEDYPGVTTEQPDLDWDSFAPENYQGEWARTPDDPLIVLLAHSDCDGVIHPEQGRALADRLEELLPSITADAFHSPGNHRQRAEQFILGLRTAAAANEDVDFH